MYMHENHVCFACMECYTNLLTHMGEYGLGYVCLRQQQVAVASNPVRTQESHISDTGNEWPSVHPEIKLLAVLNWTAFVPLGYGGNLRALMAYWSWAGASWVSLQSWILRPATAAQHNPDFNELACHMAKILHFPILWWEEFIRVVDTWEWLLLTGTSTVSAVWQRLIKLINKILLFVHESVSSLLPTMFATKCPYV